MEEARDAWSLLEEQVLLLGTPREVEGTPGCALPPPSVWCAWRDLGRLAKRPSAIILNSGKKHTQKHKVRQGGAESCILPALLRFGFEELISVFPQTHYHMYRHIDFNSFI